MLNYCTFDSTFSRMIYSEHSYNIFRNKWYRSRTHYVVLNLRFISDVDRSIYCITWIYVAESNVYLSSIMGNIATQFSLFAYLTLPYVYSLYYIGYVQTLSFVPTLMKYILTVFNLWFSEHNGLQSSVFGIANIVKFVFVFNYF